MPFFVGEWALQHNRPLLQLSRAKNPEIFFVLRVMQPSSKKDSRRAHDVVVDPYLPWLTSLPRSRSSDSSRVPAPRTGSLRRIA